ncbi:hypothetical protein L7F22_015589, partial [Adiantum nelumboides]|nr:hypothetical protein [Adiantum nelumboides]
MFKPIEAKVVKEEAAVEHLPIQEEPRVLWLQIDGVIFMPKMPTKEVQIVEEPFKSIDKVDNTQECSNMVCQKSLNYAREHKVKFTDENEGIPYLQIEEEVKADSGSSMDADTSWEIESSCLRYADADILHIEKIVKEYMLEKQDKVQEDVLDANLMKEPMPTDRDMQVKVDGSRFLDAYKDAANVVQ